MAVKLLIIEGDDLFRRSISQRLRLEQYQVFEAAEDAAAKRIVQKRDVEVVLLGLKGLEQRGLSLLRTIKALRPRAQVILMTPSDQLSLSIEGMKLGAFDDLLVPFRLETLLDRVRAACDQRKARSVAPRSVSQPRERMQGGCEPTPTGELDIDREIIQKDRQKPFGDED